MKLRPRKVVQTFWTMHSVYIGLNSLLLDHPVDTTVDLITSKALQENLCNLTILQNCKMQLASQTSD